MMKQYYYKLTCFILLVIQLSCEEKDPTKRFKISDAKMIDVSNEIIDFEIEQIISDQYFTIIGENLLITDINATKGNGIHIFNKNTYEYISSTGKIGEGPGEISRNGLLAKSKVGNEFWMPDFSKLKTFRYNLDSALSDKNYLPKEYKNIPGDYFLSRFTMVSDSIAIGVGLEVLSPSTFKSNLGKWNINSGKVEQFGEDHPILKNERTNAYFDYSENNNLIVFAYSTHDVLTLFNLDGSIKTNIIGPNKYDNENRKLSFFGQVFITEKYIITSYLGDYTFEFDENKSPKSVHPRKILLFTKGGDLVKIIDTKHKIRYFTVDEENNRIISFFLDRKVPIGHFNYD